MTIQDQCCTPAQAKRLAELGLKQESLFWWNCCDEYENLPPAPFIIGNFRGPNAAYSAFTVAELGAMLPDDTRSYQHAGCWSIYAPVDGTMQLFTHDDDKTEAQIRAAYLIHLLEHEIITVQSVNERLQLSI